MSLSKTATEDKDATDQQITVDVPESPPPEGSYVNTDDKHYPDLDTEDKPLSRSSFKDDDKDVQFTTIDEPTSEKQYFGLSDKSLDEWSRDDTDSTQGTQVKGKELAGTEFFHSPSSNNKDEYNDNFDKRRSHVQHRKAHKLSKMLYKHRRARRTR